MTKSLMTEKSRLFAIVPAAGTGTRMGGHVPKQYLPLNGRPLLAHTIDKLQSVQAIESIIVAKAAGDIYWSSLACAKDARIREAHGGETRAQSVLNALDVLAHEAKENDWVLVHDAARPCVMASSITALMNAVANDDVGGILASPISDTVKRTDDNQIVTETLNRHNLWAAQTPQIFRLGLLRDCLQAAVSSGELITDEACAMEKAGFNIHIVLGRPDNIKITHPGDLALAECILQQQLQEQPEGGA